MIGLALFWRPSTSILGVTLQPLDRPQGILLSLSIAIPQFVVLHLAPTRGGQILTLREVL